MHNTFKFLITAGALFFLSQVSMLSAAGVIPRDNLRLELLLSTGSQDTSGNNRPVTATGVAPSYQMDTVYGLPYAHFNGSGGLKVNTAWNGGVTDDFTISFWVKVKASELPSVSGISYPDNLSTLAVRWGNQLSTMYFRTIFSSQPTVETNAMSVGIRNDYKCGVGGIKNIDGYYGFYLNDPINTPGLLVDCSKLNDEKWHIMTIRRSTKIMTIRIDDQEIFKSQYDISIGKNIIIGQTSLLADTGARIYQLGADPKVINNQPFLKSGLTAFRLYNKALTDIELDVLNDEFLYAQSSLVGVGNILVTMDKYTKPNISFFLKTIPPNLSKTSVTYQYAVDGKTFFDVDQNSIRDISTNTGSISYQVQLDVSSIPDGKIMLTIRAKNGTVFQNIGTISFTKNDTVYAININQPDSSLADSKLLTASTVAGGVLTMAATRGNVCDSILKFEEYSDLLFTSKTDNAIRVCYKAYFASLNKTIYRLSDPVQGITPINQAVSTYRLFDDYASWIKSTFPKNSDSASLILDLLSVSSAQSQGTINGITMTDINGDGLVDFIYSRNDPVRRAIIVNNGNYTFKTAYKCAVDPVTGPNGAVISYLYYGDCADPTR